ncbi:MAG: ISNCY family transposase [bacterium]|nr:ISNCY family transposase [bacterium]
MAERDIIMASQRELKRLHVIRKVLDKELKQVEAKDVLNLSERQIRRIVKTVRREGDKGIVHKSRGKPSNAAISKKIKSMVIGLYKEKYKGFGPLLANEKLLEIDKIEIGTQTLRNWLIVEGEWKVSRGNKEHCQWRERKQCFGEMVQMDGSHHDWLEGRGPKLVLMGYIDDATSKTFGKFYDHEGTMPAMDSFKKYIEKNGIPNSIYLDKHTTYKSNGKPTKEDELNNRKPLSQFERACEELGVDVIHADSPQAKGRIERLFKTFQDRLIKEMRLKEVKTKEDGNKFLEEYLPIYDERFSVEPAKKTDLHRTVPEGTNLDDILCRKTKRVLKNDFTISHDNKLYQVENLIRAKKVLVCEHIDERISIQYKGETLNHREITKRPKKANDGKNPYEFKIRKVYIPPKDHPWRKYKTRSYPQYAHN